MSLTLATTALLMGLGGAPHCAAMCGAACGGLSGGGPGAARRRWWFQAGRFGGYTIAGAVAGSAVEAFAWLTTQTAVLRPAWTVFHLAVLAWGLMLLVLARQPAWVNDAGRTAWSRIRPMAARSGGVFTAGALWIFMPCGLLWSALLVASLGGGALQGALSMALFAAGSSLGLLLGPGLYARLQRAGTGLRREWGTRAAGLLLALAAGWAVWMDLAQRIALWCA